VINTVLLTLDETTQELVESRKRIKSLENMVDILQKALLAAGTAAEKARIGLESMELLDEENRKTEEWKKRRKLG
jgi:hypothetical protein